MLIRISKSVLPTHLPINLTQRKTIKYLSHIRVMIMKIINLPSNCTLTMTMRLSVPDISSSILKIATFSHITSINQSTTVQNQPPSSMTVQVMASFHLPSIALLLLTQVLIAAQLPCTASSTTANF